MLMIHVGPLFSALQVNAAAQPPAVAGIGHVGHDADVHLHHSAHAQHTSPSAYASHASPEQSGGHGLHHRSTPGEPAWLAALELCGYCELLTLNPPLSLSLQLVLPEYQPIFILPLPDVPQPAAPRRSSGHPRAPPILHS